MKRILYLFCLLFCVFLLQTTVFEAIALGGITPNLLLIAVASVGIMNGKREGLWFGFFAGLFLDLFFGRYLCLYALIYMYIGAVGGFFHRRFYPDDFAMPLILAAVTDFIYNLLIYFILFFLRGRHQIFYYLKTIIIPEVIYTMIISIPVYLILLKLNPLVPANGNKGVDYFDE